jgi:hypothetical protein
MRRFSAVVVVVVVVRVCDDGLLPQHSVRVNSWSGVGCKSPDPLQQPGVAQG